MAWNQHGIPRHHTLYYCQMPLARIESSRIAVIGGGNMARSLIGGWRAAGVPAGAIHVADPDPACRARLAHAFAVSVHADAQDAATACATWVFAVKPQVMRSVCLALAAAAQRARPLVISIAAGIGSAPLEAWLGGNLPVVRAMPNTPALLGVGMSGLFANARVGTADRARAGALLAAVGETAWVDDEALMDAVTATSGSGPAYVFLLAEAMQAAAVAEGLPAATARQMVTQTLLGAARMLAASSEEAATLRHQVTSPGGTTQAALEVLMTGGFSELVAEAIHRARMRGEALAQ